MFPKVSFAPLLYSSKSLISFQMKQVHQGQHISLLKWTDRRRYCSGSFHCQQVDLGCREVCLGTMYYCFRTNNFQAFLNLHVYKIFKIRLICKVRLLPLLKIIDIILYCVLKVIAKTWISITQLKLGLLSQMKELDAMQLVSAFDYQINLFQLHLCLLSAGKLVLQTDVTFQ